MPLIDLAPEIAVILTAVACVLYASFAPEHRQWLTAGLAFGGTLIATGLVIDQLGATRVTFSGVWALDAASTWARLVILLSTAIVIVLSPTWFRTDRRHGEYYAILLFSALGAMAMAAAGDLLELTLAVLLSSVTGYTLAAYHRAWSPAVEAGMKYFLVGALANALLAIGVVLVYGMVGASGYEAMAERLAAEEYRASPLLLLGLALTTAGLAFKLGAVPGHAWLPDVAEAAPAPAAAFLTVVPKIGAAIALVRLVALFPDADVAIRPLVAVLATVSMTFGNLAALWQDDVRRLIGWSSVSQSGYVLMAVAVIGLTHDVVRALVVFLAGYAFANLAAFAAVVHLRGRTALDDYQGLASKAPIDVVVLTVALLSLTGIPPLLGFVGKLELFRVTLSGGYGWLAAVAAINTVVSLYYYLRVIGVAAFGHSDRRIHVLDRGSAVVGVIASVLVVAIGIAAEPLLNALSGTTLLP